MTQEEKEKMDAEEMDWIEREIQMDKDRELADTLTAISVVATNLAKRIRNKAELEWNEIWKHKCDSRKKSEKISSKQTSHLQREM